jgi:glycosyltransferase involved in cell wall biosynthesis
LLESFSLVADKFPDWRLVFAGEGEIEKAKALAKKFNISNQTDFVGWVKGDEKDKIFRKSMIFCLPSFAEGFSMSIIEALSYGLPVISTRCGRIDMVLEDKKNILFFDFGNKHELANHIEKLISDEKIRNEIGKSGLIFSSQHFSIDSIIFQLEKLYNQILKNPATLCIYLPLNICWLLCKFHKYQL